jgi:small subunit ribosomal protein S20
LAKLDNVARKRKRNRSGRTYVKSSLAKAEQLIAAKETEPAQKQVVKTVSALDKAAKKGIIHPNQAARRKSRLMRKMNKAGEGKS